MTPKASVIVPCLDRADLLRRALRSVQAQTERDWEAIVVDDGSARPLADDVRRLRDPRIRCLRLTVNRGPAEAREAGMASARAPYVAFLDSDDVWDPLYLARQLAAAGPDRVTVAVADVEGAGRRPERPIRDGERIGAFLYVANEFAQASGILAPTDLARAAGFGGLRQYEDHYFLLRAQHLGARVATCLDARYAQTAAAADRLGARDDAGRALRFLDLARPLLTEEERLGFRLRHLGAALAREDPRAALRLALRGLRNPRLAAASCKLALRAAAGAKGYDAARRAVRGW